MANTVHVLEGFDNFAAANALAVRYPSTQYSSVTGYETGLAVNVHASAIYNGVVWRVPTTGTPTLDTTWFIASFLLLRMAQTSTSQYNCYFGTATTGPGPSNTRMAMGVAADGRIQVTGDAGAVDTSAASWINAGQWYHIEYRHRYGSTGGNYEVYVNGSLALSGNKDNSGVVNPVYCSMMGNWASGATEAMYIDDVLIATSPDGTPTMFGLTKVRQYLPTSTPTGQWLGSDADKVNNHLLVDDGDAASADYVTSVANAGEKDLYGHAAAPTGATVHAVQVRAAAGLDAVGVDDFSLVLNSGGTDYPTAKPLGAGTPVWVQGAVHTVDPKTGAAWVKADFDATTFGYTS